MAWARVATMTRGARIGAHRAGSMAAGGHWARFHPGRDVLPARFAARYGAVSYKVSLSELTIDNPAQACILVYTMTIYLLTSDPSFNVCVPDLGEPIRVVSALPVSDFKGPDAGRRNPLNNRAMRDAERVARAAGLELRDVAVIAVTR